MLSLDTNILLPAVETRNAEHARAARFLNGLQSRDDIVLSELVLLELYVLLRNPAVLVKPLSASVAAEACHAFRHHPRWQVIGFPERSREFHDAFWPRLAEKSFAQRRVYDWRIALTLLQQGVEEFATVNTKDFEGFGFKRVWNPLVENTSVPQRVRR
ncbi:MAG: TA system VapC family ribonuclease toxin [Gemmatimonas sp.]